MFNCDFYAHGDDLALNADGKDSCWEMKQAGRYKEFKRTRGVSTTNIVGKLLLQCKHMHREDDHPKESFKSPMKTSAVKNIMQRQNSGVREEEKESELYQQLGKAKFVATSH